MSDRPFHKSLYFASFSGVAQKLKRFLHCCQMSLCVAVLVCVCGVEHVGRQKSFLKHHLSEQSADGFSASAIKEEVAERQDAGDRNRHSTTIRRRAPLRLYALSDLDQALRHVIALTLSDSCQCWRANPLGPIRATDETVLGCLHNSLDPDHCSDG